MDFDLPKLLHCLNIQPTGEDHFSAENLPCKRETVFGGQVAAQALDASIQCTDTDRMPHSMHCHFLRPGMMSKPIEYEVQRIRDGRSFSLRQVTATQGGKPIFLATVSFQKSESGLSHQQAAPEMATREGMISEREFWDSVYEERPDLIYWRPENFTAISMLSHFRPGVLAPKPQEKAHQSFWLKVNGKVDQPSDHYKLMAFMSDLQFLNTTLHAHPYSMLHPAVQAASLDHTLWFYNNINTTQWLYYDMLSPVSGSSRGLNHGYFYTEEGTLIASSAQDGLIRVRTSSDTLK